MTGFVLYTYEFFKLKSKRSALIVFALFCFNLVSKQRKQHIQRVWNCVVTRHSAAMASVSITKPPLLQRFGANAQCRLAELRVSQCGVATGTWNAVVRLSDCKTVSLSDFQTVGLLDCLTVWLSDCQSVRLSDCLTIRRISNTLDLQHVHMFKFNPPVLCWP